MIYTSIANQPFARSSASNPANSRSPRRHGAHYSRESQIVLAPGTAWSNASPTNRMKDSRFVTE
jgi:hypothetical protein